MTSLSLLPAVLEILRLLLFVAIAVAGLVAFLWANYKAWKSEYYLGGAFLLSAALGAELNLVFGFALTPAVLLGSVLFICALVFRYMIRGRWMVPFLFAAPATVGVAFISSPQFGNPWRLDSHWVN